MEGSGGHSLLLKKGVGSKKKDQDRASTSSTSGGNEGKLRVLDDKIKDKLEGLIEEISVEEAICNVTESSLMLNSPSLQEVAQLRSLDCLENMGVGVVGVGNSE
ncbi:hypothetical protein ACH5RR_037454 [Cinchona calisaya]|uniref:Uncharacterized protein n=1 Tax=Cinchona calisaya TaxID=153742 RepID=A0ABD2YB08_9GENT